ncbi:MAG: protein TolA, partial [Casimicrobiaceae bacterium]
ATAPEHTFAQARAKMKADHAQQVKADAAMRAEMRAKGEDSPKVKAKSKKAKKAAAAAAADGASPADAAKSSVAHPVQTKPAVAK